MAKKTDKPEIKKNAKCKQYLHGHCMNTVDQKNHTSVAQLCNISAYYCDREKREKKVK